MTDTPSDLFAALDLAAVELLRRAGLGGGLEDKGEGDSLEDQGVSLSDQAKVFAAVRGYAESREKAAPPPDQGVTPFDKLQQQFRGGPAKRRRGTLQAVPAADDPGEGSAGAGDAA